MHTAFGNSVNKQVDGGSGQQCKQTSRRWVGGRQYCNQCDDEFNTLKEYEEHIQELNYEIEELYVTALTNGLEHFECNLCSFESGYEDSIKEHLSDHVSLPSKSSKKEKRSNDKK